LVEHKLGHLGERRPETCRTRSSDIMSSSKTNQASPHSVKRRVQWMLNDDVGKRNVLNKASIWVAAGSLVSRDFDPRPLKRRLHSHVGKMDITHCSAWGKNHGAVGATFAMHICDPHVLCKSPRSRHKTRSRINGYAVVSIVDKRIADSDISSRYAEATCVWCHRELRAVVSGSDNSYVLNQN
jgi:hypothetical protein